MAQATFFSGNYQAIDYTPSGAVSAGEVVVYGNTVGIAHLDIAANKLGALAIDGGVYKVTADAAIAIGKKVYWNNTAKKVTETASGNKAFGETITAASADGDVIQVLHVAVPA